MSLFRKMLRRDSQQPVPTNADARRTFLRRASAATAGLVGLGVLGADEAWAAVEKRARHFGVEPGTTVDALGRPVETRPSDPFIGEIMLLPYNFAPRGWAFCNGQLLPISSNTALFSLLGTTYGGDGRTTFGLPDLRGRAAISSGTGPGLSNRPLGQRGGQEDVTLTTPEMPAHDHDIVLGAGGPSSGTGGQHPQISNLSTNSGDSISTSGVGGGQAHNNMPPFLALNYCIALVGIFPSRS